MNQIEIEIMTEFHRHELMLDSQDEDNRWKHWIENVEIGLGHDLDGDQKIDGYSIDYAFDFFDDGLTSNEAVIEFTAIKSAMQKEK